jgi:hypothetical protein
VTALEWRMAITGTHLSADDAIKFAILEYLHVDCRLMHARQSGRVRSHCAYSQPLCSPTGRVSFTSRNNPNSCEDMHSPWSCARRTPHSSALAYCASVSSWKEDRGLAHCRRGSWMVAHRVPCLRKAHARARHSAQVAAAAMRHGLLCGMDIPRCVV